MSSEEGMEDSFVEGRAKQQSCTGKDKSMEGD